MNTDIKNNFYILTSLIRRDIKVRYLGSLLGAYWNIIHPLMMIFVYTVVFSQVMKARMQIDHGPFSYSLYLCSGLLAWNFFSEVLMKGTTTLIDNAHLLKKVSIPPFILFGMTLGSALFNFIIAFAIYSVLLFALKPVSFVVFLSALLVVLAFGVLGMCFGIILGCLNVFFKDIQQVLIVVFQLWFWLTPVVYLYDFLPVLARQLLIYNPAFPFIEALHELLYKGVYPEASLFATMFLWIMLASGVALLIYRKTIFFVKDLI